MDSIKSKSLNIDPDFVTPKNFAFYIICRKYIEFNKFYTYGSIVKEDDLFHTYKFFYGFLMDQCYDLYEILKEKNDYINESVRMSCINKINELLITDDTTLEINEYMSISQLNDKVFSDSHDQIDIVEVEENYGSNFVCKHGLIGSFLLKFTMAYQTLSLEQMFSFCDSLRKVLGMYEIIQLQKYDETYNWTKNSVMKDKIYRLANIDSRSQIVNRITRIYKNICKNGFNKTGNQELLEVLEEYKSYYSEMALLYTVQQLIYSHNNYLNGTEHQFLQQFSSKFIGQHINCLREYNTFMLLRDRFKILNCFKFHENLANMCFYCAYNLYYSGPNRQVSLQLYEDGLHNARLSKSKDLMDRISVMGSTIIPDSDNHVDYKIRSNKEFSIFVLRNLLLNSQNPTTSLSDILSVYFSVISNLNGNSVSLCTLYLSNVLRNYGFERLANTYMLIAMYQESLKKSDNYHAVAIVTSCHLMDSFTSLGLSQPLKCLIEHIREFEGPLISLDPTLELVSAISCLRQSLFRLDFSTAAKILCQIRQYSLVEYGIRRMQLMFLEDNVSGALQLADKLLSETIENRENLMYNIDYKKSTTLHSMQYYDNKINSITTNRFSNKYYNGRGDYSDNNIDEDEYNFHLIDESTRNWSVRDWAFYECRCRIVLITELINRQQRITATSHVEQLLSLCQRYHFYHIIQLVVTIFQPVLTNRCPFDQDEMDALRMDNIVYNVFMTRYSLQQRFQLMSDTSSHSISSTVNDTKLKLYLTNMVKLAKRCQDKLGQSSCGKYSKMLPGNTVDNGNGCNNSNFSEYVLYDEEFVCFIEDSMCNIVNYDFVNYQIV